MELQWSSIAGRKSAGHMTHQVRAWSKLVRFQYMVQNHRVPRALKHCWLMLYKVRSVVRVLPAQQARLCGIKLNHGKVTALVCKTNLRHQSAVLDFAVSGFESHPSHQNGIAGFLSVKQGWHIVGYITSSILCGVSSTVECQPSKLNMRVRFPYSAPNCGCSVIF